jgi:dephospho-CoA kinase
MNETVKATHQRTMRVGLTGGIASGKSAVARLFRERGVPVIDTDDLARVVVAPGTPGLERLAREFGGQILTPDGSLDRAALREMIFSDPASRRRLEEILHPLILAELEAASSSAGGPYQIHVIPLLVESGLESKVDRVLVVDCEEASQVARLKLRDGESEAGARRILASQATRKDRLASADDVILNEGSETDLAPIVGRLDRFYRDLAAIGQFSSEGLRLP